MKAVILAGGEGTRLRPLTCTVPKPLIPVVGHPICEYILSLLEDNGFDDIVFTLGYLSNEIIDFIENYKNDNIKLSYVVEKNPLGTAGSVLNAVGDFNENILVISGDCLTDVNLSKVMLYHKSINSDATLVCTQVEDPREYGTLSIDKNGKIISFNEKPSWNFIDSDLANTGIYILSPQMLKLIKKGKFQDFAKDIFPLMLEKNMNLYGYNSSCYWCDIGDLTAYKNANDDILKGKVNQKLVLNKNGIFGDYNKNFNNCEIIPPVYIGENVKLGDNVKIGPFTVLGDNFCSESNTRVKRSVIFNSSYIGENCDITGSVIGTDVMIKDNCFCLEGSVIGDKCMIDSYSKVGNNVLVWPEKRLINNSVVNDNYRYGKTDIELINEESVSGYSYTELTVEKCCKIGSAFASLKSVKNVAIGYAVDTISKTSAMAVLSGLISGGACIYDFGECFESQICYYVRYCKLDGGLFVIQNNGKTAIYIIGKNGEPLTSSQEREFERKFINCDFARSFDGKCIDSEQIGNVASLYESKLMAYCIDGFIHSGCTVTSKNELINSVINRCYTAFSGIKSKLPYFEIDLTGKKCFAKDEKDNFVSYDMAVILCSYEYFRQGKNICVKYDAPLILDEIAKQFNCKVYRITPSDFVYDEKTGAVADECPWSFDGLYCVFYILSVMKKYSKSLNELIYEIPVINIQRRIIEFRAFPDKLRKIFPQSEKTDSGTVVKTKNGNVHISTSSNGRFVKISAESKTAEISEELCAEIENKIKSSSIDNIDNKV